VREPRWTVARVDPSSCRALDPVDNAQLACVLSQPAFEQAPLPQQSIVRHFDGRLARVSAMSVERSR